MIISIFCPPHRDLQFAKLVTTNYKIVRKKIFQPTDTYQGVSKSRKKVSLSTRHFDPDQGDLFYNVACPRKDRPVGVSDQKLNLLVGGRSLKPILTDQVPREGPGEGGTVSCPAALVSLRT